MNRKVLFSLLASSSFAVSAQAGTTYDQWATANSLSGADAAPSANPDGDRFINALEYAFGTNPKASDVPAEIAPSVEMNGDTPKFVFRYRTDGASAKYRVLSSKDLKSWKPVNTEPETQADVSSGFTTRSYPVTSLSDTFYTLEVSVVSALAGETVVLVGSGVGSTWDGIVPYPTKASPVPPNVGNVYISTQPPPVSSTDPTPNTSKYPSAVGASLGAFTEWMKNDYAGKRPPLRSWLGWFVWGNGTPPPGVNPGVFDTAAGYGAYDNTKGPWDYFTFMWEKTADPDTGRSHGTWHANRLDQQPLYLTPSSLNYNWAPGPFGYEQKPLHHFPNNMFYWADKSIVRGVNISGTVPFFYQYGNKVTSIAVPANWQQAFMYTTARPLETTVIVPSNVKPTDLVKNSNEVNAAYQFNKLPNGTYSPFPYPVWDPAVPASQQTPFCIQVDKVGDFSADIIWEACVNTPENAAYYAANRYKRTPATQKVGSGNYMKMTVMQGSPLVWSEVNNSQYAIFYNLIRTNLKDQINNLNKDVNPTGAKVMQGPISIPGTGVSFVLLYGDQVNPNQWFQEVSPLYANLGAGVEDTLDPGGFNPPPGTYRGNMTAVGQHNHTYTAVYFRDDQVNTVSTGVFGKNNGVDAQGNIYFFLEFKNPKQKNFFVVGSVPEMRYYNLAATPAGGPAIPEDPLAARDAAATAWATSLGQYAFNFPTNTQISYNVTNMYQSTTNYNVGVQNPYTALGLPNAAKMTADTRSTILSLNPHQYQPFNLGPDLSQKSKPTVVWSPLRPGYGKDFPKPTGLTNANKNNLPDGTQTPSRWEYWTLRGNLKTIITSAFSVGYPFQNFLPVNPPPDWNKKFTQTGIAAVNITNVGTDNKRIDSLPVVTITDDKSPKKAGFGASAEAIIDKNSGRIQQITVKSGGQSYDNDVPPTVTIAAPPNSPGSRQATAYAQVGGGKILAIFMTDQGEGYSSVMTATQAGRTIDSAIILPPFDEAGNLQLGSATVVEGGAGFDFSEGAAPIVITISGGGTGMVAEVVKPGQLLDFKAGLGGIASGGSYPALAGGALSPITASLPPPSTLGTAQTATPAFTKLDSFVPAVTVPGSGYPNDLNPPGKAHIVDSAGKTQTLNVIINNGMVTTLVGGVNEDGHLASFTNLTAPTPVVFDVAGSTLAKATIYPAYAIQSARIGSPLVSGYTSGIQGGFLGGDINSADGVAAPTVTFSISPTGTIDIGNVSVTGGDNLYTSSGFLEFRIDGGKGEDAVLLPNVDANGTILSVRIVSGGSNYLTDVPLYGWVDNSQVTPANCAELKLGVDATTGAINSVTVVKGGLGYKLGDPITPTPQAPPYPPNPSDEEANGKGSPAKFHVTLVDGKVGEVTKVGMSLKPAKYFVGSENKAVVGSPPAQVSWTSYTPFPRAAKAKGYVARVVPATSSVDQVLYSSIISQYSTLASANIAPFGGAYLGSSAPDGYGLGGQLGGASRFLGDMFNLQQFAPTVPNTQLSDYAISASQSPFASYDATILGVNNPSVSTSNSLKSAVQSMQRSIYLLFTNPPNSNSGPSDSPNIWQEYYSSTYDTGVGRLVINPTATQPAWGVISSVQNPTEIPTAENDPKIGLSKWEKGMLWSGFGVSDQWNDQHYFYGYYLSTAALAGILDQSWKTDAELKTKPATLWADPGQMGTAVDQMIMTLAYDPDNAALNAAGTGFYKVADFTYQKFAFFDQWNGHPWATGQSPGSTSAALSFADDPLGYWGSYGTLSNKFNGENENSIYEGVQAWSATILWGGATSRKSIVDLGIYLYSTNTAAGDAYFLDKNYNAIITERNKYSWVPVTTIDSTKVKQAGNNVWPAGTSYATAVDKQLYVAPPQFGDGVGKDPNGSAPGQSLIKKVENSLNNYFYAFPTGSKFIQAYPPTTWTMGIVRDSTFMRKWAGAYMQKDWNDARASSLYQPADWQAMAMTSAMAGVPYNPGDVPYPSPSTTTPVVAPYIDRLWSSWVVANSAPGSAASLTPPYLSTSVLTWLLAFDKWGTPDWTYIAIAFKDAKGTNRRTDMDNNAIVYTATFSKVDAATGKVTTTAFAFNPTYETRYVRVYRLGTDGSIPANPVNSTALIVPPKRLVSIDISPTVK